jgi:hypothetical protein
MAMAYRTDLFKQAGLPTNREEVAKLWPTWPDYVKTGQAYMAKAPANSAFMDSASGMFNAMVGASPNQYYDQSGKPIYDTNPLVKDAWNLSMQAIQLKETAKLKQFDTAWNQAFSTGAFATIAAPSWMIGYIQGQAGAKGAGKWDVTTAPGGTGNWGGSYLAVPKASKHPPGGRARQVADRSRAAGQAVPQAGQLPVQHQGHRRPAGGQRQEQVLQQRAHRPDLRRLRQEPPGGGPRAEGRRDQGHLQHRHPAGGAAGHEP